MEAIQKGANLMDELKTYEFDTSSYVEVPISLERPADKHRRELIERQKILLDLLRRASEGLSSTALYAEHTLGKNSYVKSMDALVSEINSELGKDIQNEKTDKT